MSDEDWEGVGITTTRLVGEYLALFGRCDSEETRTASARLVERIMGDEAGGDLVELGVDVCVPMRARAVQATKGEIDVRA